MRPHRACQAADVEREGRLDLEIGELFEGPFAEVEELGATKGHYRREASRQGAPDVNKVLDVLKQPARQHPSPPHPDDPPGLFAAHLTSAWHLTTMPDGGRFHASGAFDGLRGPSPSV
jgi:hypothetical protein